CQQYNSDPVTF
nr:immunoglobulin light chain junction region [Macaca mulatta]MOV92420.1 immunoglobulin light chain junction region [Macaca mulatta]MOV92502.1 immunoglobulin light chain junction region [Macaca mulatta]MOV92523.1 immunoglobulin light chain junction region [Macaca mulatta]MOV92591.1 immunoglobulin light chain junction region [Macaca mulatta]